jgi:hypothetical protein
MREQQAARQLPFCYSRLVCLCLGHINRNRSWQLWQTACNSLQN